MEKTYFGETKMTFLGFLIDTIARVVCIPVEKVTKAKNMINYVLNKKSKKITILELQRICGFLNFIGKCIIPGRAFTRRLYSILGKNHKLKSYHHIHITREMRSDLQTWHEFVQHQTIFARPFMDFWGLRDAEELDLYTDASKNSSLGFGGWCSGSYFYSPWDRAFIEKCDPSIEFLELFALVAGALAWTHRFRNSRIILFTDNDSVKNMVNNTSSKCPRCMKLIRILVLHQLVYNV